MQNTIFSENNLLTYKNFSKLEFGKERSLGIGMAVLIFNLFSKQTFEQAKFESSCDFNQMLEIITRMINNLANETEKHIIIYRFSISGETPRSRGQLAKELNVSNSVIENYELSAIKQMQEDTYNMNIIKSMLYPGLFAIDEVERLKIRIQELTSENLKLKQMLDIKKYDDSN